MISSLVSISGIFLSLSSGWSEHSVVIHLYHLPGLRPWLEKRKFNQVQTNIWVKFSLLEASTAVLSLTLGKGLCKAEFYMRKKRLLRISFILYYYFFEVWLKDMWIINCIENKMFFNVAKMVNVSDKVVFITSLDI